MLKLITVLTLLLGMIIHIILITSKMFIERGGDKNVINGLAFGAVIVGIIAYAWYLLWFHQYTEHRRR